MLSCHVFVAALMVPPAGPIGAPGQTLQVIPLPKDGEVLVSFQLKEALTDEIRAAIHSGLTIKFVYKVDLRRSSAIWVDRTIKSAVVAAAGRGGARAGGY